MTLLLTIKEAAEETRHSASWIRQQIRCGQLRTVKFGRERRIFADELRRFIERRNVGTPKGISLSNIEIYNLRRRELLEMTRGDRA